MLLEFLPYHVASWVALHLPVYECPHLLKCLAPSLPATYARVSLPQPKPSPHKILSYPQFTAYPLNSVHSQASASIRFMWAVCSNADSRASAPDSRFSKQVNMGLCFVTDDILIHIVHWPSLEKHCFENSVHLGAQSVSHGPAAPVVFGAG